MSDAATKLRARSRLQYAVKMGRIVKASSCSQCGFRGQIDGHHPDYAKPLVVIWLCHQCHMGLHPSTRRRTDRVECTCSSKTCQMLRAQRKESKRARRA